MKTVYEDAYESMLRRAAAVAEEELMQETEIPEVQFSERHQTAMKKMFRSLRWQQRRKKMLVFARRAAVSVLVACLVSAAGVLSVDAWRTQVFNMILQLTDTHAEIEFVDEANAVEVSGVRFGFVPEGFAVTKNTAKEYPNGVKTVSVEFYDGKQWNFRFSTHKMNIKMTLDTENADRVEVIDIDGKQGTLSVKDGVSSLLWSDGQYSYLISGNLVPETMVKIAKNITFLNK